MGSVERGGGVVFSQNPVELFKEKFGGFPALITVKVGLEVWAFSMICQKFAEFRGSWCDFYPCFITISV